MNVAKDDTFRLNDVKSVFKQAVKSFLDLRAEGKSVLCFKTITIKRKHSWLDE